MSNRVQVDDDGPVDFGALEPDEFGRQVRRLARDAHRVFGCRDSSIDELLRLHARVWHLLREVPGARPIEMVRWLLAVREEIGVGLRAWSWEEQESSVA